MSSSPLRASSYLREFLQRLNKSTWEQRYVLGAVFLGQFLSVCLCGTGVTSELLVENHDISVPTAQAFLNYLLLALTFGIYFATRKRFLTVLRYNWWKYIILGVMDVEANYVLILAYRYTNLTSIQLLDCFTIVAVMVLSYVFLRTRYKLINLMGVLLTIIGIGCLVLADLNGSRNKGGSAMFLGDMLCLLGAGIYAAGNVCQEYLVKSHSIVEYLGLIGVVGSFVSGAQLIGLERMDIARIQWNPAISGLFSGFGISLFLFYTVTPWVIRMSSAVVFNLSLLTADFYTLIFGIFLFKYNFTGFYMLGFVLVLFGIFIYNLKHPVEKKLRERTGEQRRGRSIERLFSVATTKMDSSTETADVLDWKVGKIRGLLETSAESTSASMGILSGSYKKKQSGNYGTTELKSSLALSSLRYDTPHHGSVPTGRYHDADSRGSSYRGHRNLAHVEIEAGSSVRFSQSAPSYNCGGERGRREEEEGGREREERDVGRRGILRREGGEGVNGRKRHSSVREGGGDGETRRESKRDPLLGERLNSEQALDVEGKQRQNSRDGGVGEEGGEEEGDTLRRGSGREVGVGEGGEEEEGVGQTQRVSKRQRRSSALRKRGDSLTQEGTRRDSKSPSPPCPSNRKYRRRRSSARQSEASPQNRKEVNRDRIPKDKMEGKRERRLGSREECFSGDQLRATNDTQPHTAREEASKVIESVSEDKRNREEGGEM